jgi:hypothetical protein
MIRRAVVGRARSREPGQWVLLTLTSQEPRSDLEMRAALERLLAWGRKYVPAWFGWYVWVAEDQARGVLHFHVLVSRRIPRGLFRRVRALWCETYGMGPGAFDAKPLRHGAKAAVSYLCKYLGKQHTGEAFRLDADGRLSLYTWPTSRHTGEPFVRDRFRGNAYGMSASARWATVPLAHFWLPVGASVGIDVHRARVTFHESGDAALVALGELLQAVGPAP